VGSKLFTGFAFRDITNRFNKIIPWGATMKRLLGAVTLLSMLILSGCSSSSKSEKASATGPLAAFEKTFFKDLWRTYPGWAAAIGLHEYDSEIKVPNPENREEQRRFFLKYKKELAAIDRKNLSALDRMDIDLLVNFVEGGLWDLDVFKSYEWNPANYNVGDAVASVLEGNTKTENEKLTALLEKLILVPAYYDEAFKSIKIPTKEHLELAIKQNSSLSSYFKNDVMTRVNKSSLSVDQKNLFADRIGAAGAAVEVYVQSLTDLKKRLTKKNQFRSFRIGKKLYAEKFDLDIQSSLGAAQIYKRAVEMKKQTHTEMLARAKELWPKYYGKEKMPRKSLVLIKKVLDKIAENHIQPNEFLPTIKKEIPQLWSFIQKKDLLTLDANKPLKVRETPVYQRGFAGASVDAPGPFDAERDTYYNVTPLDDMNPEKQQSYLREYNNYTLHILNIHEALPGHYAQLVYSNKNPSLVKKIFGNGAMIEGWAVYAERMMLEEGYINEPEMWLMYYKWRLRVVCNTILDYSIHNLNMSKTAALKLLEHEAFQEKAEAEEKWNRATYSQVQLASYFTGFTEIYSLREELRLKDASHFKLKAFHEKFLSYGSAPVKLIRAEMLGGDASGKSL
jgi:uncharacterized protein (DUF885 family)